MATEYRDGSFGETKPLKEAIEDFSKALEDGTAKALHVGTPEEIEQVKARKQADPAKEIEELKKRMDALESEKKSPIRVPTWEEVNKVLGHES
jgi:hypothetical protein